MLISLLEILSYEGFQKEISVPFSLNSLQIDSQEYEIIEKSPVQLKLTCTGKREVEITGEFSVTLRIPCDRCTKDISYKMYLAFEKSVSLDDTVKDRLDNLDETDYIEGTNLNLDTLIYDELLVHFPMKVLCKEDCKGICYQCGTDLNQDKCECEPTIDPRMAVIQDLFSNFKEV